MNTKTTIISIVSTILLIVLIFVGIPMYRVWSQ